MKFKFIFAWYDLWVGFFWDAKKRRLYFFPVPMLGCWMTYYGKRCWVLRKQGYFYRPNSAGYTDQIGGAGRYTEAEARSQLCGSKKHGDLVTMHHISIYL